jgi:hypothetical protein
MNELLISFFIERQVKKVIESRCLANLLDSDVFVLHKGEELWHACTKGETIPRIQPEEARNPLLTGHCHAFENR